MTILVPCKKAIIQLGLSIGIRCRTAVAVAPAIYHFFANPFSTHQHRKNKPIFPSLSLGFFSSFGDLLLSVL
jgi:hypothetical protein